MPKREGQYTGEIEMETDYEVSKDVLSSSMHKWGNSSHLFLLLKTNPFVSILLHQAMIFWKDKWQL